MTDETIFATALEKADPAERAAFLAEACQGDAERRERLEGVLAAHAGASRFLERPAAGLDSGEERTLAHDAGTSPDDDEVPLGFLAPATRPDSLGRIGHYEVLQVLGKGGFGIVFRAFDDVLHRVVAVKVLSPQMAATSPARKRFLREARSSAQVRHENVVQVYEVGEQPLPYIAMEFIPGETLQQRLDRTGPIDVADILRIGRQIAEGLAAAHATDLIHRDIKPGNVLLEAGTQRVKITDFGLARAADDASISQSGIIAGTPMFMAPEQAKGETLDQRADLFSLGSVLYQMAAGRPPFRANGTLAVLKRVAEDTPRPIREVIPETPQWLCDIISKLHAKNPEDRFQSAREVAHVLADCETQLGANARLVDASRIPRRKAAAPQRASQHTARWFAATVLLVVIGVTLVWWKGWANQLFTGRPPGAVGTTQEPGPPAADDKARFQGRWRMVGLEQRGKSLPVGEHLVGYRVEFIGDLSVTYKDGKPHYAPFTLNPGADPKELTILPRGRATIRHVYKFEGDALVIALGGSEQPRPTGFTTTPDSPWSVATSVRDNGPPPSQPQKDDPSVKADPAPDPDRRAAEYVLSFGAGVYVRLAGNPNAFFHSSRLPQGPFRLRQVVLHGSPVTDEGLAVFKDCKHLESLNLVKCEKITDAGLVNFEGSTKLIELNLEGTLITDAGLAHFGNCKKLRDLLLHNTRTGDGGLEHFKDCRGLRVLQLHNTRITDSALAQIARLDDSTEIFLTGSEVTAKGVEGLAKALPKCKIEWDGGAIEPK